MSLRSSLASFFGWDKPTPIPNSIARAQQMFQMLNGYTPAWTSWNGQIYESELVRAAIEAKAQHMSKLKFEMIGNAKPSLKANLRRRPCAILTWSQWFAKVSRILDVYNTCFLIPTFDQYGEMDGIYPAVPANAELVTYGSEHELYLRYTFSGGITAAIEFKYCGIITRHQLKNDFFGERNDALKPTMELINMVNQGIDANIKNAASYKFLATLNNFSKDSDLIKERKRFTAANFGKDAEDNHGVLLFPNYYSNITQIKYDPYSISDQELKQIQTNVYNYFGTNEDIVQNKADNNKLDSYYNSAIEPLAIQISEVCTKMIFTDREQSFGNECRCIANRLQYLSVSNKVALVNSLATRGAITLDEIREIFNYAPLPDGAGKKFAPIRGEYKNVINVTDDQIVDPEQQKELEQEKEENK